MWAYPYEGSVYGGQNKSWDSPDLMWVVGGYESLGMRTKLWSSTAQNFEAEPSL